MTAKLKPEECHFNVCDFGDGLEVFVSIDQDEIRGHFNDNIRNESLAVVPKWFPDHEDAECTWSIPKGVSKKKALKDMIDLGYIHKPSWP